MAPEDNLLSIMGKLDLSIGGVNKELEAARKQRQNAYAAETPRFIRITGTCIASDTGFGVIQFDNFGPDQGYFWYVRKLCVGGKTPTTAAAGRADVFTSAQNLMQKDSLAEISLVDWQDQASALPLIGPYGNGELIVKAGEKLYVVISGGTVQQQYYCVGTIAQYQEAAAMQNWGV